MDKYFEIGNGLKSIKLPKNYVAEQENDNTVLFYNPDENNVWIRVSVITVEPKDKNEKNSMYNYIVCEGKKENHKVVLLNDKSYFVTHQQTEEDGDKLDEFFFYIGFLCNHIILSVTTLSDFSESNEFQKLLSEIPNYISSIEEISLEKTNVFEPQYSDYTSINKRISSVFEISEDEVNDYHENDKTIILLQKIIDDNKYSVDNTFELQSLGLAFGDYLSIKYPSFHWIIVRDEYGRDLALQYNNYSINVFPMAMISKRIEDGKKVDIKDLVESTINTINEMVAKGIYKS
jgi:hypothetical protein